VVLVEVEMVKKDQEQEMQEQQTQEVVLEVLAFVLQLVQQVVQVSLLQEHQVTFIFQQVQVA